MSNLKNRIPAPLLNGIKTKKVAWKEHDPTAISPVVQVALHQALRIENASHLEYADFLSIMAQESNGQVNARNSHSTARGLFQLLRNQYPLNPNGEKSFGNVIEECQGGIRYVTGRSHSAFAARQFWQRHHWY
ncbi:MAG: hypothetical protein V4508_09500 [Pseudomonadota bacterium]